jgi:hypothetical protein
MAIEAARTPSSSASIPIPAGQPADFDERWTAWLTKGAAHERATNRRMVIALPILLIVAVIAYMLLVR